jgi:hypothetical protein
MIAKILAPKASQVTLIQRNEVIEQFAARRWDSRFSCGGSIAGFLPALSAGPLDVDETTSARTVGIRGDASKPRHLAGQ